MFKATQVIIGARYDDAAAYSSDEVIGTQELQNSSGYVDSLSLVVTPKEWMTCEIRRSALLGVGDFLQKWKYQNLEVCRIGL